MRLKDALLLNPPPLGLFIVQLMMPLILFVVVVLLVMLCNGRVTVQKPATVVEHETR